MPDDDGGTAAAGGTVDAGAAGGTAGASSGGSATPEGGGDAGGGTVYDIERAMNTIRTLREKEKEGTRAAKERDDALARLKALEDEKLSADERREKRLSELESEKLTWAQQRQEMTLRLAVYSASPRLGVADADLALAALDRARIEYGADGQPTNLDEALNALLEAKPILKAKPAEKEPSQSAGTNAGDGRREVKAPSLTAEELEMAKAVGMTPERYASMKGVQTFEDYQRVREAAKA